MTAPTRADVFNSWSEGLELGYRAGWANRGEGRYPPDEVFPPDDDDD